MEKKKTYVLMLSELFPKTHNKAGMPTEFKEKVLNKKKIHTIRANFPLWEKRIKEVQEGRAVLSIRQWTGEPYRSKQVEIVRLAAEGGVGVQKLCFPNRLTAWIDYPERRLSVDFKRLAKNDGLSLADWCDWFRHYDLSKPMAIINFTKFRY
jgi:hypothetical protein